MYLIDTYAIIWFLEGNPDLSPKAKNIIENEAEKITVSCISFWELAIKLSIGKLILEYPLDKIITSVEALWNVSYNLNPGIFHLIENMPFPKSNGIEHRDPFDRMLISQAITNNLQIISCDEKFDLYQSIKRIW